MRILPRRNSAFTATAPSGPVVSGTTGSPTITSNVDIGGTLYDIYEFTGSGSITFSTGGDVDYLLVGGGGGSGVADSRSSGGGGAGGVLSGTKTVSASTITVTVGAGGSSGGSAQPGGSG